MRERGVRRARMGALELELGDLPVAPAPFREESEEEREYRLRNALKDDLAIRYAHVGGWSGSDAELDRMLGLRR